MYASGNVEISGSATVTAKGGSSTYIYESRGVKCAGLSIKGGKLTATGQAAKGSWGVEATTVTVSSGTLNANGGNASGTATNFYDSGSHGILCDALTISGGTVTAKGGTSDINGNSYGVEAETINLSDGKLTGQAFISSNTATSTNSNYGVYTGVLDMTGGELTAKGTKTTNGNSYGLYVQYGKVSGGTITGTGAAAPGTGITSGSNTCSSYGVYAGTLYVSQDAEVEATANSAKYNSFGMFIQSGSIADGAKVEGKGGQGGDYSAGLKVDGSLTISDEAEATFTSGTTGTHGMTGMDVDGKLTVTGSPTISATSTAQGAYSYGISAGTGELSGGTITSHGAIYGMQAGKLTVNGNAKLISYADGYTGTGMTYTAGIRAEESMTVSGAANVEAYVKNKTSMYYSLGVITASLTVQSRNAVLEATGGDTSYTSAGVYTTSALSVTGGELTAKGGKGGSSYGVYKYGGTLKVSGGGLTAISDDDTTNSRALYVALSKSDYTSMNAAASTKSSGESQEDYKSTKNNQYHYVRIESGDNVTITVSTEPEGKSSVSGAGTYKKGTTVNLIASANAGYEFDGWYENDEKVYDKSSYSFAANQSAALTAMWIPIRYTVGYNLSGGTVSGTNPTEYTVETNSFTLINPAKEDYDFAGWTGSNGTVPQKTVTIAKGSTGDRSYTANWTKKTYSVTVINGTATAGVTDGKAEAGAGVSVSANAPQSGYAFTGWEATGLPEETFTEEELKQTTLSFTMPENAVTLKATYAPIPYTISYDLDGGTVDGTNLTEYTVETESFTLINPTKDGYTFAGWTGTGLDEATDSVTIAKGSTGDRSYTATWTKDVEMVTIKVTINPMEHGTVEGGGTFPKGTEVTVKVTPAAGRELVYWTATIGGIVSYDNSYTFTAENDIWLTANMCSSSYKLTAEHGSTWVESQGDNPEKVVYQRNVTATAEDRTNEGYTFTGWEATGLPEGTFTEEDLKQTTLSFKMPANDVTLKATYAPIPYTISYELDGGTVDGTNRAEYTVETESFTLINPTKDGYTFAGWTGTGLDEATDSVTIAKGSTGDRSYTATWTKDVEMVTIKVTINPMEHGTVEGGGTFPKGTEVTVKVTPAAGRELVYWTATIGGIVSYDNSYTFTAENDIWLTANMCSSSYKLTAEHGSTWVESQGDNPEKVVYQRNVTATAEDRTNEGYTFTGWEATGLPEGTFTEEDLKQTTLSFKMPANDVTLKATYAPIPYTISYDLDGGTVDGMNRAEYTVETESFTLINPTKAGYTFAGWTGTGIAGASDSVTIAKGSTGDRSYTATWTKDTFTVTVKNGTATAGVTDSKAKAGTDVTVKADEPQSGYVFTGWKATGVTLTEAQKTAEEITFTMPGNDVTLEALYTQDDYTISCDLNGGSYLPGQKNPLSYSIGDTPITLVNPIRDGYTFAGWTGTQIASPIVELTIGTGSTGDLSFIANWTPVTYTIRYELDGGTVAGTNPATYTIETPTFTLINPTKAGHAFLGWTGTNGETPQLSVKIETGSTKDRAYRANWKANEPAMPGGGVPGEAMPDGVTPDVSGLPKTGDSSSLLLWGAVLVISGVVYAIIRRRRSA